jgi:hypothetical protein
MSDLKLLSPDQPTPLERLLLDAAANEAPSNEQRLRVRQALGLPALMASIAPPPIEHAGRTALLMKGAGAGALVISAALMFAFAGVGQKSGLAPLRPNPVVPSALVNSASVIAAPLQPALELAQPTAAPMPAVEVVRAAMKVTSKRASSVGKAASASASARESGSDLSEQLRLIDAARSAVAAGNASAASQALSSYSSQFPRGTFGQEAAVLRIETMNLQGNHAQAAALARNFLARHPNSPHVGVVQDIAGRAQ